MLVRKDRSPIEALSNVQLREYARQLEQRVAFLERQQEQMLDSLEVNQAMQALVDEMRAIDIAAAGYSGPDLRKFLANRDEKLSALFTRWVRKCRTTGVFAIFPDGWQDEITDHVARRIDAIQLVNRDGGQKLREVVKELSPHLREYAEHYLMKAKPGRRFDPQTVRLVELTEEFRFRQKLSWHDAGIKIINELEQASSEIDQSLHASLVNARESGERNLREYVRKAYNRFNGGS